MTLRYGSVCSGIEAATVAWHPLGWQPQFFSEIDAAPRAVLSHHYPGVPLHGDFTTIQDGQYGTIDLLVGGTPCQSFSVAGLRGGLADDRGNLALQYLRLAQRLRPRWLVWENVPGVLSSNGGRDFGAILGGMGELGYGVAYRVLDAQYVRVDGFGRAVPQRRRRVFVVGYLGDWRRAAAVLFERASLRGDLAPRRIAGAGITASAAFSIAMRGRDGGAACELGDEVGHTLRASTGGGDKPHALIELGVSHSLRAEGFDASEDGTGRGTPIVPIAFDTTQITSAANRSNPQAGDPCHPLASGAHAPAVAFTVSALNSGWAPRNVDASPDLANTLDTTRFPGVQQGWAVRRLTPGECEALQGFPRDYTLVPTTRGMMADGPRYKALGNSMAVNAMRWIGRRIEAVEAMSVPVLMAAE
ncbi:DNA cytosine methyltransferase [Methylobacterium sp. Leaf106]|uniref:DNA cytosine methyltransferase n=1 Tax=Methylobacterium sp. Leaf106 TaxID=1736255 RepID=UPI0009EB9545|nr:DNA cytosine methyltransferase [Methylobacterium sp. Leaf106]